MGHDELPDDPSIDELLTRLDHPTPAVTAGDVIARARRRAHTPWRRIAAIVVVSISVLVGGVYAAPSALLPSWVVDLRERIGPGGPDGASARPQVVGEPERRGVALDPQESVTIEVAADGGAGWMRIRLQEAALIEVRSPSAATVFTSEPARLLVHHATPDTLELTIPVDAAGVRVVVGERTVWAVDQGTVRIDPGEGRDGGWIVSLSARGG